MLAQDIGDNLASQTPTRAWRVQEAGGVVKFEQIDERYLAERERLAEKYGPRELWSIVDHWPLYCGIVNLARWIAILDVFRTTLAVPGHIAEIGSWRGANLLFLAKLLCASSTPTASNRSTVLRASRA